MYIYTGSTHTLRAYISCEHHIPLPPLPIHPLGHCGEGISIYSLVTSHRAIPDDSTWPHMKSDGPRKFQPGPLCLRLGSLFMGVCARFGRKAAG